MTPNLFEKQLPKIWRNQHRLSKNCSGFQGLDRRHRQRGQPAVHVEAQLGPQARLDAPLRQVVRRHDVCYR